MWQQLTLRVRSSDAEDLEANLLETGAQSITYLDAEDQAVFQEEPGSAPLWPTALLVALYPAEMDLAALIAELRDDPRLLNGEALSAEPLAEQIWERTWMEHFEPRQFAANLWICPSWQSPPDPKAVNVLLDPGLAFGTGTHPTTAMCLTWLAEQGVEGQTVIDYGCGSGVLAIAALLLGASRVIAIDNDPQALIATRANGRINGLSEARLEVLPPELLPPQQADLLLANILAAPLIELSPRFKSVLRPDGHLVLSGILHTQQAEVCNHYESWVRFTDSEQCEEWVRLAGIRWA